MNTTIEELEPGETIIDRWPILYYAPGGGKYRGKLTITGKRILFDVWAKVLLGKEQAKEPTRGRVEISKTDIKEVQVEETIINKKIIVLLTDGSTHVFDYGALNVDKVLEAIYSH